MSSRYKKIIELKYYSNATLKQCEYALLDSLNNTKGAFAVLKKKGLIKKSIANPFKKNNNEYFGLISFLIKHRINKIIDEYDTYAAKNYFGEYYMESNQAIKSLCRRLNSWNSMSSFSTPKLKIQVKIFDILSEVFERELRSINSELFTPQGQNNPPFNEPGLYEMIKEKRKIEAGQFLKDNPGWTFNNSNLNQNLDALKIRYTLDNGDTCFSNLVAMNDYMDSKWDIKKPARINSDDISKIKLNDENALEESIYRFYLQYIHSESYLNPDLSIFPECNPWLDDDIKDAGYGGFRTVHGESVEYF